MAKHTHEIRDPIHTFIRLDTTERQVVDSRAFQRLRNIHQLALTYLVYPGATHRRFEHSLGVMELASRVYDVVTEPVVLHGGVRDIVPPKGDPAHQYWRRVLRMAALCHDIGHLPFSHGAEKELLPEGWDHERITMELIRCPEMVDIWQSMTPPLRAEDVVKLAVGPKQMKDESFDDWQTILSEIIVGDAFGVDRMDYLLRDSFHAGVAYGTFDRYRLIDTLRILPREDRGSSEPELGLEEGGLQSAEALMLARYFMYRQVYFHPVRRIYDLHLQDFLKEWLSGGFFSTDIEVHLRMTDVEVLSAMHEAARNPSSDGHSHAAHIVDRTHFKLVYERNPTDQSRNRDAAKAVHKGLCDDFGEQLVRYDEYFQKGGAPDFPVLGRDGRIVSSLKLSDVLNHIPLVAVNYVFGEQSRLREMLAWVNDNRDRIIGVSTEPGE